MTREHEAELAQRRLRNAIACDGGEVRLTDDERVAINVLLDRLRATDAIDVELAAILRGLLERMK